MLKAVVRTPLKSVLARLPKFQLPERLKGGAIENATKYLRNVYLDYKAVYLDTRQDIRDRPLKAAVIGSILVGMGYLMRHNPNEEDFVGQLVNCNNKLLRVPENIRNPTAYQHIDQVATMYDQKILRHQSLGIFSVIYRDNYSPETDLFAAQCKFLRPSWKSYLTERIVDIGILDNYQLMKQRMIDYDVSPEYEGLVD